MQHGGEQQGSGPSAEYAELLRALAHHLDEVLVACSDDGTITWAGGAVRRLLGYDAEAVVGQNVVSYVHPDEVAGLADSLARWTGRPGAPRGEVHQLRRADGTWVAVRYDAVTGPTVAPLGHLVLTLRAADPADDATIELRARDETDARLVRLASLFLHRGTRPFADALDEALVELSGMEWITRLSVWRFDERGAIRQAMWEAPVQAPVTPLPPVMREPSSVVLRRLRAGHEVHLRSTEHLPDDWATDREAMVGAGVRSFLAVPLVADQTTLGFLAAEVTLDAVAFDANHLMSLRSGAAIVAAAMVRELVERELDRRARTDPLTGLGNRFAFDEALGAALDDLAGGSVPGVGVAIVDLDRFKLVNDALGHVAGDRLLADAIGRIAEATPPGTFLARLGGDELLVLHAGAPDLADAVASTRHMLAVLDAPFDVGGQPFVLTASAGVTHTSDHSTGAVELVRRADVAMYRAKAAGGDAVETDDDALAAEVAGQLRREAELRAAIEGDGLEVHYQGEWDLRSGRLVGAEALARWRHPRDGLVAAGDFVPLAEASGLITSLGERVIRDACHALASWLDRGLDPDFVLRINLSAHQLRDQATVALMAEVLEATGVPPTMLCLELTESAILTDPDAADRALRQLRELGIGVALDDFGTGYSSMLELKRLPISALKIDQAFVAGLPDDEGDAAIVQAVVHLADLLDLSVTAEGVETEVQRDCLLALSCHRAQGFLLARAEPADTFATRLALGEIA